MGGNPFLLLNAFLKLIIGETHSADPEIPIFGGTKVQGGPCVFFVLDVAGAPGADASLASGRFCYGSKGAPNPRMR